MAGGYAWRGGLSPLWTSPLAPLAIRHRYALAVNIPVDLRSASAVIELFDDAAVGLRHSPVRDRSVVRLPFRGHGRLLATGDLHDNPSHLAKIVRLARLDQSADHHVVLHEIIHGERLINGMDFSFRSLARVAELVVMFPGQVHVLLANHELAQLTGKGVSKGAGNSVALFNEALDFVFSDDASDVLATIQRFIAAMPLALMSETASGERGVLCAHSLPAPLMMKRFDLGVLDRDLTADDYLGPFGSAHLMVWGRGHTDGQIEQLATAWNVDLFILGHEHVATGIESKGPRLIVLNSDHERGCVLPIDLSNPPRAEEAMMHAIPLGAIGESPGNPVSM
jgi:hypothetical protein